MKNLLKSGLGRLSQGKNRRVKPSAAAVSDAGVSEFKRFGKTVLGGVLVVGISVGLYAGWQSLYDSERLMVQELVVDGLNRIEEEEIEAYLGEVFGRSILELDLDALAFELRHHPWIEGVTVRRRLPATLIIVVTEFEPGILVSLQNVYVANKEGDLFKRLSGRDGLAFPVLTGLSLNATEVDSKNTRAVVRQALEIDEAVSGQGDIFGRLEEIHYDEDLGWSVVTQLPGKKRKSVRIHLGKLALRRISTARDVLVELKRMKKDPAVVWVDGKKNPDRVHIRLRNARSLKGATKLVASVR